MDKPERAHVFEVTVQGDSVEDVAQMLEHLAYELRKPRSLSEGVSGGYSSGAMWSHRVNETTGDEYREKVAQYVKQLRQESSDNPQESESSESIRNGL